MDDVKARWIIRSDTPESRTSPGRVLFLLALLLVALGSVAHGLADVVRELDARLLLTVAALGALAGWMMAAIPLPGWLAGILTPLLGAEVVFVRVGRLGGKLAAMVWAMVSLIGEIWYWLLGEGWRPAGPPPDWIAVSQILTELWADTSTLLDRGREWILGLVSGHPAFDPVATALLWSLAIWAVAVWAGWAVRRHKPLQGITPAGALLVATFSYAGTKLSALLTLLGTTLLLMAMVRHDDRERRWRAIRIDFSFDIWKDLAVTAALLSLALVVTAALTPSITVRKIVQFAQQLTSEQEDETELVAKSLGLEAQPNPEKITLSEVRTPDLPRLHTISFRPQLSQQVVMVIRTSDLRHDLRRSRFAPMDRDLWGLSEPPWRYYWRSTVYDRYTGHGWTTSQTKMVQYEAGEPVIPSAEEGDMPFHRVLRQEVQVIGDPSTPRQARDDASSGHRLDETLHVAGTLVTADHDFSVAWRSQEDAFAASSEATTYRADSLVPVISEEQLRSAGSDYPEWVKDRYLALPDQVPDRVLALARDLTATEPTPYDRALAIESYLRRTFSYTLDVPSPPFHRDAADYFLFDLQRGHCDYYATTMAVLARASGLPARLVVGYANGTYDADNVRYLITEADAHAWVEVYFPEYGWVEFEPTAGRPPIERQAESLPIEWPEPEKPLEPAVMEQSRVAQLGWLEVLGALAVVPLVGIVWWTADIWRLRLLTPVAAIATLYRRLQHHGRRLGMPMREGDTPYEFATSFAAHFANLARGKYWWDTTLAPAVQEAQRLVSLYVQASYTPRPTNTDDQRQAIQTWQWLRRRLWMVWVLQKWWGSPLR